MSEPQLTGKGTDQMASHPDCDPHFLTLRAADTLIVIEATQGGRPLIIYAGTDLVGAGAAECAMLAVKQQVHGGPDVHLRGSFLNEIGSGVTGPSGLIAHRGGMDWAVDLRVSDVEQPHDLALIIACKDLNTKTATRHFLALDPASGMLSCSTEITNLGAKGLDIQWCASLCLPLDDRLGSLRAFTGRWASEFQVEHIAKFRGSFVRENKSGRTSHDAFPGLIALTDTTSEHAGLAAGFHLAWSGNSRIRADRHSDGRAQVQMGELLFPGEMRLAAGESYRTPDLLACWSNAGVNGISHRFHQHLRKEVLDKRAFAKPRPVHYNTWEAVYFDHNEATLLELADKAAEVGAERFVLDDGWFGARRNESAGLGDWWVSKDVYPNGLHPLVERVHDLGMEFGLWFEPEMVNPDSDLFRAHPDWVLHANDVEAVPFRGQHTLDLTKPEVAHYLFEKITALVSEYGIAYIKWDMNRDTNYPGSNGRGAMHLQTLAVYRLIDSLRDAHPKLEIESCSSGGARADFGILRYADRIWTSDNNDARQRQAIQRGASHFFPLRVMGSHVGPARCHNTGRRFSMEYRVGSALFGHMGMELDLRDENEADRAILAAGIALHKRHRELIHGGDFFRLRSDDVSNTVACIAGDKREALVSHALTDSRSETLPPPIHFTGLDSRRHYRVKLVWPQANPSITSPSIVEAADLLGAGTVFAGSALMGQGLQPPLILPDTCLIYHLEAED